MIQVGGGIFGDIIIHGSIGKLYAGYLGTNSIDVDGDVGTIIVGTQAGGIAESDNSWRPADDAIMNIGGELSNFHCLGDWGLPIRVQGSFGRSELARRSGCLLRPVRARPA